MPDLAPFENPAFYDELQVLTREATHRPLNLMVTTGHVVPNALAAAGLLFLVGGPLRPFVLPTRRRPGARLCARHYIPNSEHSGLAPLGRGHGLLAALPSDLVARLERAPADAAALDDWLRALPVRPVLVGNVYDPSFGDDRNNFLGVDPALARRNHRRMNAALAELGHRYGAAADLHGHFLTCDTSWFTRTIEPSLVGASEVRRAFLPSVLEILP
ncbi:MAG TPA: hypothetical protein VG370_02035 [Chloroflexota bacterium]|jgi:hypothetical protein|nr:hypothetical protein [Chloroflexota bacterium]